MSLLSNRNARKLLLEQTKGQVLTERVLVSFLNRGLFGRLKWLLFGY